MDKQRVDVISVEISTITDDIEDFIDENEIDENTTKSKVDYKISNIEELKKSYRKIDTELKISFEASYEELKHDMSKHFPQLENPSK